MRALILDFCKEPKSFLEIMSMLNLRDRVNFKRVYISPLDCGRFVVHDRTRQPNQQKPDVCSHQDKKVLIASVNVTTYT